MATPHVYHPSTVAEAVDLLSTSPLPIDSPTQRRLRTELHLVDAFAKGRRRPEWVWAVGDGTGRPREGVVAGLGPPDGDTPHVLDHFGLPADPAVAAALLERASHEARALGAAEVGIFAPPGSSLDMPGLRALAEPLRAAGWRLLVERRHYEFQPLADLAHDVPIRLELEQLSDPDDPRLAAVYRQVMRETLDEHDRARVDSIGFEAACTEGLRELLEADPVECLHLARDGAGEVVGMVSVLALETGRGFLLFVGVAHEHRGNGYSRDLLGWATRSLVSEGSTVLIADTDNANIPMAATFAAVGWPQTETRIDLVPARRHPRGRR